MFRSSVKFTEILTLVLLVYVSGSLRQGQHALESLIRLFRRQKSSSVASEILATYYRHTNCNICRSVTIFCQNVASGELLSLSP